MKYVVMLFLLANTFLLALSSGAKEGKEYYLEANCQKCHFQDSKWVPKGSKATDYKKLKTWINQCGTYFRAGWFPEDEALVLKYVNEIGYHYKK